MLDINMIHNEIKKLEECDCTTWGVCDKLATLYIIRDHYVKKSSTPVIEKEETVVTNKI